MKDKGETAPRGTEGAKAKNSQVKGPYPDGTLERLRCVAPTG